MLSRVAENTYWMARYVERAENVARLIDVNHYLTLESGEAGQRQWEPLISIMADEEPFKERYPSGPTEENVLNFMVCDEKNSNSIVSCLRMARDNTRSIREIVPSEMWLQLNTLYLTVRTAAQRGPACANEHLFEQVKMGSHLFFGFMNDIMSHNEAHDFAQLGRLIERADKASRVIDVKYFLLLPRVSDVGTPIDLVQWIALLKSVSAYEMYRKRMSRVEPSKVVAFLLLDKEFPRSVYWCLERVRTHLRGLTEDMPIGDSAAANELADLLLAELESRTADEIIAAGLHEYVDHLQRSLNELHNRIYDLFFSVKPIMSPSGLHRVDIWQAQD